MTKKELRTLRAAAVAAEANLTVIRRRTFDQRTRVGAAQNADIRARGSSGIPRPRGADNMPLTKTQIAVNREKEKLAALESQLSSAVALVNSLRGELLAGEETVLSARREELAVRIADRVASTEEHDELRALCPPDHFVPINQQFAMSPLVKHALTMICGDLDPINTPVDQLNGTGAENFDWTAVRARILEERTA